MLSIVVAATAAYLLGSIPFGYLAGRIKGIDLRAVGSGNIGATNAGRVLGRGWGWVVFILDFGKGAGCTLLGMIPAFKEGTWPLELPATVCGAAAFIGHLFPVYLGFRGGKGVATGAGVIACLIPTPFLNALILWLLVVLVTRMISAGSVVAAILLAAWGVDQFARGASPVAATLAVCAGIAVIIKHLGNIKRIVSGTENRLADGQLFQVLPERLLLAAGGAWLGIGLFFSFTVGLGVFGAFEELSLREQRPYWLALPEGLSRPAETGLYLPDPLQKEQGSLLAGVAVSALFPWYFHLQTLLGAVCLGGAAGCRPRRRWLISLAAATWLLALAGWGLERHVESLRIPRNEWTTRYILADDAERTSLAENVRASRAAFRQGHTISLLLNLTTLVGVAGITLGALTAGPRKYPNQPPFNANAST
jgi:acyl-phosphate glycerol 3-phosphate acyltransferase